MWCVNAKNGEPAMSDRPIHLDARDIAGRMGSQMGSARGQQQPTPQEAQRFAQVLKGEASDAAAGPAAQTSDSGAAAAFPVFTGLMGSTASPADTVMHRRLETLGQDLSQMVQRMMVGDGSTSADGRQLMLDISDELLPGVTVAVFEDAGAWVAEFRCRQEGPFELLAEQGHAMAARLSETLGSDAVWRVLADGLTPGGSWERLVDNRLEGLPSFEAFATCAHPRR